MMESTKYGDDDPGRRDPELHRDAGMRGEFGV